MLAQQNFGSDKASNWPLDRKLEIDVWTKTMENTVELKKLRSSFALFEYKVDPGEEFLKALAEFFARCLDFNKASSCKLEGHLLACDSYFKKGQEACCIECGAKVKQGEKLRESAVARFSLIDGRWVKQHG